MIKHSNMYIFKNDETFKTLMKDNKDNTNRWRDIPCFWIGRINIAQGKFSALNIEDE